MRHQTWGASPWPTNRALLDKPLSTTTGLQRLGVRDYDPTTGRFTSRDPIIDPNDPQQLNGYNYANNSPTALSDPEGLAPCGSWSRAGCTGNNATGGPSSAEKEKARVDNRKRTTLRHLQLNSSKINTTMSNAGEANKKRKSALNKQKTIGFVVTAGACVLIPVAGCPALITLGIITTVTHKSARQQQLADNREMGKAAEWIVSGLLKADEERQQVYVGLPPNHSFGKGKKGRYYDAVTSDGVAVEVKTGVNQTMAEQIEKDQAIIGSAKAEAAGINSVVYVFVVNPLTGDYGINSETQKVLDKYNLVEGVDYIVIEPN